MAELNHLADNRLLPALPMLEAKGLVSPELVQLGSHTSVGHPSGNAPAADRGVLEALQRAGVRVLVLKGTLLAHTVYGSPEQRLRVDTDLLVPPEQRSAAEQVLRDLGLAPITPLSANTIDTQELWVGDGSEGRRLIDLHWLLLNNPVFADLLGFEELWERRQPFTIAGFTASGLGPCDALLHAALHYFVHHVGQDRPAQWLLDGDLLWLQLNQAARDELVQRAMQLGVAGLLGTFLQEANARFQTGVDTTLLNQLQQAGKRQWRSGIMRVNGRPLAAQWLILRTMRGKRARLNHLRRLLFPSKAWMLAKYPEAGGWSLPWLYARRALEGWEKGVRH
ncbi:nucleotidyltransferase family protein [Synechococcus sp. CCY 0621]|uniref:nucleotidyltransferase family protein n=1 Tax=Synechococcus sp. CCY 0621 TaxID=2815603 RepID=UPI001C2425CD|nr:nucleotidyltransferase family protein [Synechococcus sp. CCY 0621]